MRVSLSQREVFTCCVRLSASGCCKRVGFKTTLTVRPVTSHCASFVVSTIQRTTQATTERTSVGKSNADDHSAVHHTGAHSDFSIAFQSVYDMNQDDRRFLFSC